MVTLDHVNIVVTEMERSVAFYTRLLGLTVVMDRRLDGPWFERVTGMAGARAHCVILAAPQGACRIELLAFEASAVAGDPAAPLAQPGLRHVALRVDDLEPPLAMLARDYGQHPAVVDVPADIVKGGKRMCYLTDPDGAIVELCAYGSTVPAFG